MNNNIHEKIRGLARLGHAVRMVWASARGWTLAGLALMLVQALLPLLMLYLVKLTVDAVEAGIGAVDRAAALRQVMGLIMLTGGAVLLNTLCRSLADLVREHQSQLVTDHVTDLIHRQSAALDLGYYEDAAYHDTFYRAQREAPYRPTRMVYALTRLGQDGIALLALGGLLIYLHWGVALVLFAAVLPGIAVRFRQAGRFHAWYLHRTETERRAHDYHRMLTDTAYAGELRLFDLGDVFRERFRQLRKILRGERLRLARMHVCFELAAQTAAVLALFGLLVFVTRKTLYGAMTLGDMVMYYQAFQRSQAALQGIMAGLAELYEDGLFLNHLHGFLGLQPRINPPAVPAAVKSPVRGGVAMQAVGFRYPGADRDAVHGIDLHIPPDRVVALVGDNGAGKTTLAKLLCRLYEPTAGSIMIDGRDIRDYDVRDLRRRIAVIFQDFARYPLTARENIWVGDVTLDPLDQRIVQAARRTGADRCISAWPGGYDTMLGKHLRQGRELSAGEWQQVALARTFLRDARLLILDEPTSAMSAKAEAVFFASLKTRLRGRSGLIISHRFSTVRMADHIYVLEQGAIVEQGSHAELVRRGGRYAAMFDSQARHFY